MTIWKTQCSHNIYQNNGNIRVFENWFYRWLQFDSSAMQTLINKRAPHRPGLHYVNAMTLLPKKNPGNTILLGLGGAGIIHVLSPYYQQFNITAVEINQEVIDIAYRFFLLDTIKTPLKIIHQDANVFLLEHEKPLDYILVDLFEANRFPCQCLNETFFLNCERLLTSDGLLILNIASFKDQPLLMQLIQRVFKGRSLLVPIKKSPNTILYATKNDSITLFSERIQSILKIKQISWDYEWGWVGQL